MEVSGAQILIKKNFFFKSTGPFHQRSLIKESWMKKGCVGGRWHLQRDTVERFALPPASTSALLSCCGVWLSLLSPEFWRTPFTSCTVSTSGAGRKGWSFPDAVTSDSCVSETCCLFFSRCLFLCLFCFVWLVWVPFLGVQLPALISLCCHVPPSSLSSSLSQGAALMCCELGNRINMLV